MKHTLVSLVLFVVLAAFGYLPSAAHAQDGVAVKVQPTTIDESVEPGQTIEGTLRVTNENGGTQTYFISTRDVTGMTDVGRPEFAAEGSIDELSASTWIRPSIREVDIAVGETVEIPYEITIPQSASPGSYFAAFFVTREAEVALESGAGVGFHVASLVNLRVKGDVVEDMQFREFYTDKSFYTEPTVLFTTRLENTGTVHERPRGIISISDSFGNNVGQVTINDSLGAILPRFERVYEAEWKNDGFTIGKYHAIASILYGDTSKQTITRTISFWIVPVREVGFVLGGLALVIFAFVLGLRLYIRRTLRKAGVAHTGGKVKETSNITFARRMVRTLGRLLVVIIILFIGVVVFFS
jgi:hypothetical protein